MPWIITILIIPYLLMIFKIWTGLKKIVRYIPEKPGDFFVSVIIPCHNEEKLLPLLLESIAVQTYPPTRFEVIVVDDNSTDKTRECAESFSPTLNIKVLENRGNGKKEALRTGIATAGGEVNYYN